MKMEKSSPLSTFGTPHTIASSRSSRRTRLRPSARVRAGRGGGRQAFPVPLPRAASYGPGTARSSTSPTKKKEEDQGLKIAFLYYDSPAGKEPLPILEKLQKQLGFELRTFGVRAGGRDGFAGHRHHEPIQGQLVVSHMFGRHPRSPSRSCPQRLPDGPLHRVRLEHKRERHRRRGQGGVQGPAQISFVGLATTSPCSKRFRRCTKPRRSPCRRAGT